MKIYKIYYVVIILILSGCSKDDEEITEVRLQYKILRESRQTILTQEYPWESQLLGYFNIIKEDTLWRMWYVAWGKEIYGDIVAFCFAYSYDGEKWKKTIPDSISVNPPINDNILMSTRTNNSIMEPFVFYDEGIREYKLIASMKSVNGLWETYLSTSIDGIKWYDKKLLVAAYLDTQFSVIIKDNLYYIYCRDWNNGFRSVSRFIIDRKGNFIGPLRTILTSQDVSFKHIYNNAASLVNNRVIVFPTLYDQFNDRMYISIGFEEDNIMKLTYDDISKDLFFGEDVKWGIVSPGLIPTDEKNIYWMYYHGDINAHYERPKGTNNLTKYYRIKIEFPI